MKKRKIIIVSIASCLVLAAIIAVLFTESRSVKMKFPIWKTPCLEADEPSEREDIGLRFTEIDFDVTLNNVVCDTVLVKVCGVNGKTIGYGNLIWVDYFYDSDWHTVWSNNATMLSAKVIDGTELEGDDVTITVNVPNGLFALDGQYRMYIEGLGYCDIDIIGIENN